MTSVSPIQSEYVATPILQGAHWLRSHLLFLFNSLQHFYSYFFALSLAYSLGVTVLVVGNSSLSHGAMSFII